MISLLSFSFVNPMLASFMINAFIESIPYQYQHLKITNNKFE